MPLSIGRLAIVVSVLLGACATDGGPSSSTAPDTGLYAQMGEADIARAGETMQRLLENEPDGASAEWQGGQSGASGRLRLVETFQTDRGTFCRRYDETVTVGGRTESYRRTACRSESGRWLWTG
ncbi:MAG: hypothetical protein RLO50_11015 [Azospirillaceae bacterium]